MTATIRACLDEAGIDAHHHYAVLAACFALDEDWPEIEAKWERLLIKYKLTLFHAKDFHARKGEFKGWSRLKKERFVNDVNKLLKGSPFMFAAVGIHKATHKEIKDGIKKLKRFKKDSDVGLCFRAAAFLTCKRIAEEGAIAEIKFVAEDGPYTADMNDIYQAIKRDEGAEIGAPLFAHMMAGFASAPKGSIRGLEIADFLADRALKDIKSKKFPRGRAEQIGLLLTKEYLKFWESKIQENKEKRDKFFKEKRKAKKKTS